jgi:hypothetical protein
LGFFLQRSLRALAEPYSGTATQQSAPQRRCDLCHLQAKKLPPHNMYSHTAPPRAAS